MRFSGAVLGAFLFCSTHAGAYTKEHFDYCVTLGGIYNLAAAMRDAGMSPQQVYATDAMHQVQKKGVAEHTVKTAINNVFFKTPFAIPSPQVGDAVTRVCLEPSGPRPLK